MGAIGATHAEVETLIEENSRASDVIVFTDGSVVSGQRQEIWLGIHCTY